MNMWANLYKSLHLLFFCLYCQKHVTTAPVLSWKTVPRQHQHYTHLLSKAARAYWNIDRNRSILHTAPHHTYPTLKNGLCPSCEKNTFSVSRGVSWMRMFPIVSVTFLLHQPNTYYLWEWSKRPFQQMKSPSLWHCSSYTPHTVRSFCPEVPHTSVANWVKMVMFKLLHQYSTES